MSRRRAYIPLPEQLAAALSMLLPQELRTELREKRVPAAIVISMFERDHVVLHAFDGADLWWNLTPTLKPEHRDKSRRDTSIVAKVKRLTPAQEEMQRILTKPCGAKREPKAAIRGRSSWPKGRKLQSRNTFRRPTRADHA